MKIKRIYEKPAKTDGTRVLVDRIWPRGMAKDHAAVDLWLKEIAPSAALRKWFAHEAKRWPEFQSRYRTELDANAAAVQQLRDLGANGKITLVYGAHDTEHNNAVALMAYLADAK